MIYLHKFIPVFFSPIFLVLFLAIFGLLFHRRGAIWLALGLLILASNPFVGHWAMHTLEREYPALNVEYAPRADYIVVLSGTLHRIENYSGEISYEFNDAVDRFLTGVALYHADHAPKIVFTRGQRPWSPGVSEGEVLMRRALELGVLPPDILLTAHAENTADEAKVVREMIPEGSTILLITSAFHMNRAKALFEKTGLRVLPFAVDYRTDARDITIMDFMPSTVALGQTSLFVREMVGRAYYYLRG